jgi:hypothetical protein
VQIRFGQRAEGHQVRLVDDQPDLLAQLGDGRGRKARTRFGRARRDAPPAIVTAPLIQDPLLGVQHDHPNGGRDQQTWAHGPAQAA